MLGSICESDTIIKNLSNCDDVLSTIHCLKDCGAKINIINNKCIIKSSKLVDPEIDLNCGNSGTTARLLIGLLSSQGINANFIGDKSLSSRPMDRVLKPLSDMKLTEKVSPTDSETFINILIYVSSSDGIGGAI